MKVDLDELERVAKAMDRWEDEGLAGEQECMKCGESMHKPSELEPTPLCNACAQAVVDDMPALVARIRELEAAAIEAVRTIEGWVTCERIRALVEKGTTR